MRRARRGISMVEVAAALLVLAAATVVFAQLLASVAGERRADRQQQLALSEAASALELALASPYNAAAPAEQTLELTSAVHAVLGTAACQLQITPVPAAAAAPAGQRVLVTLRWGAPDAATARRVQLVGWKFSPAEAAP